jgi:hypothetical protein
MYSYNGAVRHNRPEWWMVCLECVVVAGLVLSITLSLYLHRKQQRLILQTAPITQSAHESELRREQAVAGIPVLAKDKMATAQSVANSDSRIANR